MFCPNCGTQNEEGASPCKKCGFKLSGVSAPKFKGTMMLSSDQSVQQLVEEHRRKLEEQAASGSTVPPSVPEPDLTNSKPGLKTVRGGLQPARPALPRPRPGGTVHGVAPQMGGYAPAAVAAAAAAMPAARDESLPVPSSGERAQQASSEPFVEAAPMPLPDETTDARQRLEPSIAAAGDTPTSALRRSPAGAGPTLESAAPPRLPDPAAEPSPGAALPAQNAVGVSAGSSAMPAPPVAAEASSPVQRGEQRAPARVRPLEVFLILITFGLYGLVLLMRQRRQQPSTPSRDIEH